MTHSGSLRPWWKIHLLPIVIIGISALLVARLGELSFGVELSPTSPALAAEGKTEDKTEHKAEEAGHEATSPDEPKNEASTSTGDEAHDATEDERPLIDYPVEFTPGEVAVLQNLAKRRDELVVLEKGLEARERLLNVTEERLDNRIAELQLLRDSIEALVRQYDEQEESELQSIVKIYETMKPKDAASILGELDMQILLGIMESMKERKSASILAAMDPERAREVTTELARKRVIDLRTPATTVEPAG
jgi:flagellar motility protein MotE (MotC chaperone)